jgi:hypothetical protein
MVVKRRVRGHGLSPALRCRHQDKDLKQFSQSGAPQFTNATAESVNLNEAPSSGIY